MTKKKVKNVKAANTNANSVDAFLRKFPVVGTEFDMLVVDVVRIRLVDGEGTETFTYNPMLVMLAQDHVNEKVNGGLVLLTGADCADYSEVADFVASIEDIGLFMFPISAFGTVYDELHNEIETVNWNDHYEEELDIGDIPTNRTLH